MQMLDLVKRKSLPDLPKESTGEVMRGVAAGVAVAFPY
jgi:hypothetical protein